MKLSSGSAIGQCIPDANRQGFELFLISFFCGVLKEHVTSTAWNDVEVQMGYGLSRCTTVQLEDHDALRSEGSLNCPGYDLRTANYGCRPFRGDLHKGGGGFLGDHQGMPFRLGHDIHEGQCIGIFIDVDTGQFVTENSGEDVVLVVAHVTLETL